jgi:hypothetical protein
LVKVKAIVIFLLAIILVGLPLSAGQLYAEDDETSMDAQVEVLPSVICSYGASVIGVKYTLMPFWALREPDYRTAYIFWRGEVSIKLKNTVKNTETISVWAAGGGRPAARMKVYVSKDGRRWKQVNNVKINRSHITAYDTTGNFGDVGYIRIEHQGGRWTYLRLDSVCAKGGDTSKNNMIKPNNK